MPVGCVAWSTFQFADEICQTCNTPRPRSACKLRQGDADVALFSFRNGVLAPGGIAEAAAKDLLFARELPGKLEEVRALG